jgi:Arc/MetJ-type ribon-helix-helix transcriptional regulator
MAEAESPPDKTTVNIRMTETFLEDIDASWEEQGFNSRSEFIRFVLRDVLKHPEFNRADLKAMLAGEAEIREGGTHSSEEVKTEYGTDTPPRGGDAYRSDYN